MTVWYMWVLVVFGDSTMLRGSLQEPPFLNYPWHLLANSRRHGDCCYCPPHHYCHPVAAAAAGQGQRTLFPSLSLSLLTYSSFTVLKGVAA